MNYAFEMGLGVMIYIPSFIQIGSGIQNLIGSDTHADTDRMMNDFISVPLFFQNKESRLESVIS
jgi:hypothetical protein